HTYPCLPPQSPPPLLFFFQCYPTHRALHSFPTRRSSDLQRQDPRPVPRRRHPPPRVRPARQRAAPHLPAAPRGQDRTRGGGCRRSEEHTSELQSRSDLVCRLLLEKKNERFREAASSLDSL